MTIYAISGFPGAGKTTLRTTDPKFTNLPPLDVADFYRKYPGIHSNDAFALLLGEMDTLVEQGKDVVVEATLFSNSIQRVWLGLLAGIHGVELKCFIHCCCIDAALLCSRVLQRPAGLGQGSCRRVGQSGGQRIPSRGEAYGNRFRLTG